jgi:hypothetical protein
MVAAARSPAALQRRLRPWHQLPINEINRYFF